MGKMQMEDGLCQENCYAARLCVTNDTRADVCGRVKWAKRDPAGRAILQGECEVNVPPLSAVFVDDIDIGQVDPQLHHLSYCFETDGSTLNEGFALFTAPKDYAFGDPQLTYRIENDVIIINSEAYAKGVEIDGIDGDLLLEDNFFDMESGERRILIIGGDTDRIKLRSVYDVKK
jgi:beta-mannosidase